MQRAYFDHNASTPVAPEAAAALAACLGQVYGNASSVHWFGQQARERLEVARRQVAALAGADPRGVVFTGGGTESDNLAILGAVRAARPGARHVVTTAIEHPAVLGACAELERLGIPVTYVPVSGSGVVDPEAVRSALRPETVLVSVMHANNELGTVQPLAEIARLVHEAGAVMHSDGVQAFGRLPACPDALGVDLYSVSGHKLYAPKGTGALLVSGEVPLAPLVFGGRHERGLRPGTENVPGAAAFGAAAEVGAARLADDAARLAALRDRLEDGILARVPRAFVNGARDARVPNTANLRFEGIAGEALLIALDLRGFAVSSGAACSSGAVAPSHVLTAIGLTPDQARASVRFSLGRGNTGAEVDALVEAVAEAVAKLRRVGV